MSKDELRALVPGDRLQLRMVGGTARGVVTRKFYGILTITWDGAGGIWYINPRARYDRERATPIERETK